MVYVMMITTVSMRLIRRIKVMSDERIIITVITVMIE